MTTTTATKAKAKRAPVLHRTQIEWVRNPDGSQGFSWNPVTGCSHCSPGCDNCYAAKLAATRLSKNAHYQGLAQTFRNVREQYDGPERTLYRWTGEVREHPDRLLQPLRRRKPAMVFTCDMGDLFHPAVEDSFIDKVFTVMAACPQHFFVVLTKRPARMAEYLDYHPRSIVIASKLPELCNEHNLSQRGIKKWPLANVMLMATCCNQEEYDRNVPELLGCPAAWRGVSAEPLLTPCPRGPVNRLDWVIVGGETGPNARLMRTSWARDIRGQCQAAGVPFFFKHWGTANGNPPVSLMSREMPTAWHAWAESAVSRQPSAASGEGKDA